MKIKKSKWPRVKDFTKTDRKQIADNALVFINNFIEIAGWKFDSDSFLYKDPITNKKHVATTAFLIQIERDLDVKQ